MEIELKNVSYNNIINNLNYTFKKDSINFIVGESGIGKTILSYLLVGLISPTKGIISVDKENIKDNLFSIRKNIGYVFQNPSEQFFNTTVKEELEFAFKNYNINYDDNKLIDLLNLVSLNSSYLTRNPFSLSSGEKEKLAIAIALSLDPNILILDEPTKYLDVSSINNLNKLLKELKKDKNIIIISNNIDFIEKNANNILILKERDSISISKNELLKDNLLESNIIEFINESNRKYNLKLKYTHNIDILIKDIINNVK